MPKLAERFVKLQCKYGHPLVEGNLTKSGTCLTCYRRYRGYKGQPHNRNKTHCPHGHPYEGDNVREYRVRNVIRRTCVTCKNEASRKRYREKLKRFHPGRSKKDLDKV
jgi:hypothetical protein